MKKIIHTIITINICLFITQLILSLFISTDGASIADIDKKIQALNMENNQLTAQINSLSALPVIQKAASLANMTPAKITSLGPITVAQAKINP
jgi:cell division protein FtsL